MSSKYHIITCNTHPLMLSSRCLASVISAVPYGCLLSLSPYIERMILKGCIALIREMSVQYRCSLLVGFIVAIYISLVIFKLLTLTVSRSQEHNDVDIA